MTSSFSASSSGGSTSAGSSTGLVSRRCPREQAPEAGLVEDRHARARSALSSLEPGVLARRRRSRSSSTPSPAALPPRARIASLASSREKPSSEPVTTTVSPSRVRGADSSTLVGHPHAGRRPLVEDRGVPVDARTTRSTASAITPPTPSAAASSSRPAARIASIEPKSAARARAAVGPTWRIDRATSTRHSGRVLAAARLAISLAPLADRTRPPTTASGGSVFFAARVYSGTVARRARRRWCRRPGRAQVEQVALVGDDLGLEQRGGALPAERLDVEGAAAGQAEQPLAQLGRAGAAVGAADVLVALLLRARARCRTRGSGSA